jgi:serine/threonine protein kinase
MEYIRGAQIKDGGEGFIFEVQGRPDLLIKIYKDFDAQGQDILTPELIKKLEYMQRNPPKELIDQGTIAWPIDFVREHGKIVGFVMPKLKFDTQILQIYAYKHPVYDKGSYDAFPSSKSRIGIAINLASTIHILHSSGYVIGDLNHENIGINRQTGTINIVDCDSFHIDDHNGTVMRTNVIMPGYLAPEIIAHCNEERAKGKPYMIDKVALPTFSKESDLFCLAVHIFKLLMNGVDPFRGVLVYTSGSAASPFQGNEAIARNAYVFKEGYKPSAVFCLTSNDIPSKLAQLFREAFIDGHQDPTARPSAEKWYSALLEYYNSLSVCQSNNNHNYYSLLPKCPFCDADNRHATVQSGVNPIAPAPPKKVTPQYSNPTFSSPQTSPKKKSKWPVVVVIILIIAIIVGAILYAANLDENTYTYTNAETIAVEDITLSESHVYLELGDEYQISASVVPSDAEGKIKFNSKSSELAVSADGKITAPSYPSGNTGTYYIDVSAGSIIRQVTVTVSNSYTWRMRDKTFSVNSWDTYPLVFDSAVPNCSGFSLSFSATANIGQNWRVYIYGSNNKSMVYVDSFYLTDKNVEYDTSVSFAAQTLYWIAVVPSNTYGDDYNSDMDVLNLVYNGYTH